MGLRRRMERDRTRIGMRAPSGIEVGIRGRVDEFARSSGTASSQDVVQWLRQPPLGVQGIKPSRRKRNELEWPQSERTLHLAGALDEAQRRRKQPTDRSPPDTLPGRSAPDPANERPISGRPQPPTFPQPPYRSSVLPESGASLCIRERAFVHVLKASS
ncbi:hypothetical protein CDAR_259581 [Caerostris darwini]|uniref:Uncharacterized protein n=1 Tax=Caerostris darwini TaxID=1538125 RepID=A0AAV4VQJ1_9ARAC|nr:hypothetical protein CDAR_259581 [Caerostris darwini]